MKMDFKRIYKIRQKQINFFQYSLFFQNYLQNIDIFNIFVRQIIKISIFSRLTILILLFQTYFHSISIKYHLNQFNFLKQILIQPLNNTHQKIYNKTTKVYKKQQQNLFISLQKSQKINCSIGLNICLMLKTKHLQPWLLIYTIASLLLFLGTISLIVIIIVNDINGFNFSYVRFLTCLMSTNFKFNSCMQVILKINFVLAILACVMALGQVVFLIVSYCKFRQISNQNIAEEQTFQQLTRGKLIFLYGLNFFGIIALTATSGSYCSLFIELNKCSADQNKSSTYLLPSLISGATLIFQLLCIILLLKIFHSLNKQLQQNQESQDQSNKQKNSQQRDYQRQMKRKILQSNNRKNIEMYKSPSSKPYSTNSTDLQSPQNLQSELLNKNSKYRQNYDESDSIYQNQPNKTRNRAKNGYNQEQYQGQSQEQRQNQAYQKNGSSSKQNPSNYQTQLSPNSVSAKQKQVRKKIPKYPYKKGANHKVEPTDIIFQEEQSENQSQEPPQLQFHKKRNQPGDKDKQNGNNKNNGKTQRNNQNVNNSQNQGQNTENNKNNQNQNIGNQQGRQQLGKSQKPKVNEVFKSKYFNSPYLKNLQDKNITPEQRRNIKRKFLKIHSNIMQFDAKNYQIDDFLDDQNIISSMSRKKSNIKSNARNPSQSSLLNVPNSNQKRNTPKHRKNSNQLQKFQLNTPRRTSRSYHQQPHKRFSNSKSAVELLEISKVQDKKLQNQNPIFDYVEEDQGYENHLDKILQFQKLNKRRRRNPYNPFQSSNPNEKEPEGKLYLYKSKVDQFNRGNMSQFNDQQEVGFDPFHDDSFEDQIYTQRLLMIQKQQSPKINASLGNLLKLMPKNQQKNQSKKSIKDNQNLSPAHIKKSNRKDGQLLDFIRSKYTID